MGFNQSISTKMKKTRETTIEYKVKKKSIYLDLRMVHIQTVGWCRITSQRANPTIQTLI